MAKNPEHLTCLEVLDKSSEFLRMKGVPSPKCDSEWIISSVLEKKRLELYLKPDEILSEEAIGKIRAMVVMRGKRIPLQHILQSVNFAGILLKCDRRALIPRPETESLVDHVLGRVPKSFEGNILDLGIGSGAILIALCLSLEQASGIGLDSSEDALALAEENIITQGLEKRIHLRKFDWHVDDLSQIDANLIISNPPYLLARVRRRTGSQGSRPSRGLGFRTRWFCRPRENNRVGRSISQVRRHLGPGIRCRASGDDRGCFKFGFRGYRDIKGSLSSKKVCDCPSQVIFG